MTDQKHDAPTVEGLVQLAMEMAALLQAVPKRLPMGCYAAYDAKKDELRAYAERLASKPAGSVGAQEVPNVDALWQDFCRTADYRRCLELADDHDVPSALFVAFRNGLATPAPAEEDAKREAVKAAVAAIYFDDNADYESALWTVVHVLNPRLEELLKSNPGAAYSQATASDRAAIDAARAASIPAAPATDSPTIPQGWRFYAADASINGRCSAMLKLDAAGEAAWFGLGEDARSVTNLFVSGVGIDLESALRKAIDAARESDRAAIDAARAASIPAAPATDSPDSVRLDWLDKQVESYGFQDMHEGNRWLIEGPFATIRKAIDAAIESNRAQGQGVGK